MSGDHDHDEYAREDDLEHQIADLDQALDTAYAAIAELIQVCRTLATIASIQPSLQIAIIERLNKAQDTVGTPIVEGS